MSDLEFYLMLEARLGGPDDDRDERVRDVMDRLWWRLSGADRERLDRR